MLNELGFYVYHVAMELDRTDRMVYDSLVIWLTWF